MATKKPVSKKVTKTVHKLRVKSLIVRADMPAGGGYDVSIQSNGDVQIGCANITYNELLEADLDYEMNDGITIGESSSRKMLYERYYKQLVDIATKVKEMKLA